MDSLDCKICHITFDEEEHRPQLALCGHGLCAVCLKALIVDKIFVCPKCRQESKMDGPEYVPVNFDLIDVMRSFKSMKNSLANITQSNVSGSSNDNMCKVHQKHIDHRCMNCQLWICNICIDSHCKDTNCHTVTSARAMEIFREENSKDVDNLISIFEDDYKFMQSKINENNEKIKEITEERQKLLEKAEQYGKEVTKFHNLLDQGKILKDKLIESKNHLFVANSPYSMMDGIEVLAQMKQSLRSWSVKNLGTDTQFGLIKVLQDEKDVYVGMDIKNEKKYGILSKNEGKKYLHVFRAQSVPDHSICIPFERIQDLIPPDASLVFMEFALAGVLKGRVLLRLYKHLPNIRKSMVILMTGQQGKSLVGIKFNYRDSDYIQASDVSFGDKPVYDSSATSDAKRGEVVCDFSSATSYMWITLNAFKYRRDYKVVGCIESDMDIVEECRKNFSHGMVISDCGVVIET